MAASAAAFFPARIAAHPEAWYNFRPSLRADAATINQVSLMNRTFGPLRRSLLWMGAVATLALPARAQEPTAVLDTLHVTAAGRTAGSVAAATRGVQIISAAEIRRAPVRSVAEVLAWALGVDLMPRSPALADVAVRGSSFEQVLVLVDGVRVSDAQTGHFDLNLAVPLDQVERIEVLRGPASAAYGADAMGGIINVVTRPGGGTHARAEAGSWSTQRLALGHTAQFAGGRTGAGGELSRSDGHRPGTDFGTGVARGSLAVPLAGQVLRADVGYAARSFGADGFYGNFPSYERTRTWTASLGWRAPTPRGWVVEPVLSVRRNQDDFILKRADPAFYRNQHITLQWGGELIGRGRLAPGVNVAAGGEWFQDRIRSARLGDREESRAALLGELAVGRVGTRAATAGVRADWHSEYGSVVSPSVAAAWWPVHSLRLRASAGHAFRAPTWTERFYRDPANVGDPSLRPERAWSAEAGADAQLRLGLQLSAAAFARHVQDQIDWAKPLGQSQGPWVTRNVETARFRGVEVEANGPAPGQLRWTAHGTWLSVETEEAQGFTSKYALRPLTETVVLGAERTWNSGLALSVRARRARRAGEGAYLLADARIAYRLRQLQLFADGTNLFNEDYPDITGRRAAGRALFLGAEWRPASP